jgi:predicted DNA-binding transcriptional regulator AlpA
LSPDGLAAYAASNSPRSLTLTCGNPSTTAFAQSKYSTLGDRTVYFEYIEQMASSKTVASIADVHVATVNRAVKAGELPEPAQISSRRVAHQMADVRAWLAKRSTPRSSLHELKIAIRELPACRRAPSSYELVTPATTSRSL